MTGSIACQSDLSFSSFPKVHNLPMTKVGRVERIAKVSPDLTTYNLSACSRFYTRSRQNGRTVFMDMDD